MSASGLKTSHQYSFQGSKDLFKQILFKTCAFVRGKWSFPFQKHSFWWRLHRVKVQVGKRRCFSRPHCLAPHSEAVLEEQKEGRAEDAETRPLQRAL